MKNEATIFSDAFIDTIGRFSVLYLVTPVILFFTFWLKLPVALIVLALFIYLLRPIFFKNIWIFKCELKCCIKGFILLFSALISFAFVLCCFPAWDSIQMGDAIKHGTLLADLSREPWPVVYYKDNETFTVLRYSFAYYLIPAAIAKIFGQHWLNYALVSWTTIGVFLFFLMVVGRSKTIVSACFSIFTAALFSGLGIIYILANNESNISLWSSLFGIWARGWGNQWLIGSHPFELRWSPQHALPAWLAAGLIYHYSSEEWFKKSIGILAVILILWSPFVAFSFITLLILAWMLEARYKSLHGMLIWLKVQIGEAITVRNGVAGLLVLGSFIFLTADSAGITKTFFIMHKSPEIFISQYLIFTALEFGILVLAIRYASGPLERTCFCAVILLMALPFTHVGAAGDLQMRGSQLPFTYLMFAALASISTTKSTSARISVLTVLLVGFVGGIQEFRRPKFNIKINNDIGRYELPMPLANFELHQAYVRPQYLAQINRSSALSRYFLDLDSVKTPLKVDTVLEFFDLHFLEFGTAHFDKNKHRVESVTFTDAALVTQDIPLPSGWYQLETVSDWDIKPSDEKQSGGHISLHDNRILIPINSKATEKKMSAIFYSNGDPIKISFGLGGQSLGKGFLEIKKLKIFSVKKS